MDSIMKQAWQEASAELGREMRRDSWCNLTLKALTPQQEAQSQPFIDYMYRMYGIYKENLC